MHNHAPLFIICTMQRPMRRIALLPLLFLLLVLPVKAAQQATMGEFLQNPSAVFAHKPAKADQQPMRGLPITLPFGLSMGMAEAAVTPKLQQGCIHYNAERAQGQCLFEGTEFTAKAYYEGDKLAAIRFSGSQSRGEFAQALEAAGKRYPVKPKEGVLFGAGQNLAGLFSFSQKAGMISGEATYAFYGKKQTERLENYVQRTKNSLEEADNLTKDVFVRYPRLEADSREYRFAEALVLVRVGLAPDSPELVALAERLMPLALEGLRKHLEAEPALLLYISLDPQYKPGHPLTVDAVFRYKDGKVRRVR